MGEAQRVFCLPPAAQMPEDVINKAAVLIYDNDAIDEMVLNKSKGLLTGRMAPYDLSGEAQEMEPAALLEH